MSGDEVLIIFSLMIFAGVGILWMAMSNRHKAREMEHRERLAMIQQGMVPAPEVDPLGFESHLDGPVNPAAREERWRTAGTLTIGLGTALLVLLSVTGGFETGFAIGGAFIVLGASFLFTGMQLGRPAPPPRPAMMRRPPAPPSAPPPPASY